MQSPINHEIVPVKQTTHPLTSTDRPTGKTGLDALGQSETIPRVMRPVVRLPQSEANP
jgi:hypothetical protein